MANSFNIDVLHNNFELLRSLTGLKKGAFARLIGISNAYRKDFKALGFKMVKGITDNFSGVDEEWLSSAHPEGAVGIIFTPRKNNEVPSTPEDVSYPSHEDYMKQLDKRLDEQSKRLTDLAQMVHALNERLAGQSRRNADAQRAADERIDHLSNLINSLESQLGVMQSTLIQCEKQKDFLPLKMLSGKS